MAWYTWKVRQPFDFPNPKCGAKVQDQKKAALNNSSFLDLLPGD